MSCNEEGIEKLIELEVAFMSVSMRVSIHTPSRESSYITRHTEHGTRQTSHVKRHKSHVTRHTSHVTRHTSLTGTNHPRGKSNVEIQRPLSCHTSAYLLQYFTPASSATAHQTPNMNAARPIVRPSLPQDQNLQKILINEAGQQHIPLILTSI